jgi:hypothetical protein
MRTALQNVWSFRERARLARRNSVHALDRVLRPEPREEFLDATPEDGCEDALFLSQGRGREIAVAIDLGYAYQARSEGLKS